MRKIKHSDDQNCEVKSVPLSETIDSGMPCIRMMSLMKRSASPAAVRVFLHRM